MQHEDAIEEPIMVWTRRTRSMLTALWMGLATVFATTAEAESRLPVPFAERFDEETLNLAWTVDVSEGNAIEIANGALAIRAAMNTYAHIERPLGNDLLLAWAAPRHSPAGGTRLAVRDAPTRFGPVSYVIEPETSASVIGVHLDPLSRIVAGRTRLRLRHPASSDVVAVGADPGVPLTFKGDVINLPKLGRPVGLTVRY